MSFAARAVRRNAGARRRAAARRDRHPSPRLGRRRSSPAPRIAIGACDDDDEAARFRRRGARRRRAGQRHRQAGVLRFRLRRHRQPLAAGDRHFDRRRGAGVRAGDPRQARGADPARLCALGRGGAALARRRCKSSGLSFAGRRRFWQMFTAHAVAHPDREPAASRFRPPPRRDARPRAQRPSTARSRWSAPAPAIRNC